MEEKKGRKRWTNSQRLADHHGAPDGKEGTDDMYLSPSSVLSPKGEDAKGDVAVLGEAGMGVGAVFDPPGHHGGQCESGGDGEALKVL